MTTELVAKKVTRANEGLGINSVGLATGWSLVSKLLQKAMQKKMFSFNQTLEVAEPSRLGSLAM